MRTKAPRQRGRRAKVTSSPETIFYVDENGNGSPGDADKNTLGSGESKDFVLQDTMTCVSQEGYQLIIKSFGRDGISACDSVTDNIRWEVRGELPGMQKWMTVHGMATDGQEHLFICDTANECIQMFSLYGDYLDVLLRSGEDRIGTPLKMCWCQQTSSAVVLHYKNNQCYISVFCKQ